jgi:hypothetical protein
MQALLPPGCETPLWLCALPSLGWRGRCNSPRLRLNIYMPLKRTGWTLSRHNWDTPENVDLFSGDHFKVASPTLFSSWLSFQTWHPAHRSVRLPAISHYPGVLQACMQAGIVHSI